MADVLILAKVLKKFKQYKRMDNSYGIIQNQLI